MTSVFVLFQISSDTPLITHSFRIATVSKKSFFPTSSITRLSSALSDSVHSPLTNCPMSPCVLIRISAASPSASSGGRKSAYILADASLWISSGYPLLLHLALSAEDPHFAVSDHLRTVPMSFRLGCDGGAISSRTSSVLMT